MSESTESISTAAITRLEPGQPAPDFTLTDDHGNTVSLRGLLDGGESGVTTRDADARGTGTHRVILYFYPAAMTPGCTTEACDFRDRLERLVAAGYTVVGISKDLPDKLAQFRERDHLTFPLLSDPDFAVHQAYGAYGERKLYGKVHVGPIRSTFVVEGAGANADEADVTDANTRTDGQIDVQTADEHAGADGNATDAGMDGNAINGDNATSADAGIGTRAVGRIVLARYNVRAKGHVDSLIKQLDKLGQARAARPQNTQSGRTAWPDRIAPIAQPAQTAPIAQAKPTAQTARTASIARPEQTARTSQSARE